MTTTNTSLNTLAQTELDFILFYTLPSSQMPIVRHSAKLDSFFELIRKVVENYPSTVWYIVRRSDGVCLAQSKQEGDNVQQPVQQEQADTALVLPGCVTNMMLRSKSSVQQDGAVVFKYEGKVKSRLDLHAFYVIADDRNWGRTYNRFAGGGEGYDWTLYQDLNSDGETTQNVRFEMRDYSKKGECDLEQRIARIVLRNQHATPAKVAKLVMTEIAR